MHCCSAVVGPKAMANLADSVLGHYVFSSQQGMILCRLPQGALLQGDILFQSIECSVRRCEEGRGHSQCVVDATTV